MSMNPAFFLQNLDRLIVGKGFKKEVQIPLTAFHLASDGSLLPGGALTVNEVAFDPVSNTIWLVWGVALGSGNVDPIAAVLVVPQDYDETEDYLKIRIRATMSNPADTAIISAVLYRNGADADLGPDATAALDGLNYPVGAWVEIDASNLSILAGDVLTITLTPGAHDTSAIQILGTTMEYKSDLVYYDEDDR